MRSFFYLEVINERTLLSKQAKSIAHGTFNERIADAKESAAKAQELARNLGIKDRAKLNHAQLIQAIEQNEPK